jgi:hypothetical protein
VRQRSLPHRASNPHSIEHPFQARLYESLGSRHDGPREQQGQGDRNEMTRRTEVLGRRTGDEDSLADVVREIERIGERANEHHPHRP